MKMFLMFFFGLLSILSINLEASDNCSAIRSYIYDRDHNTLILTLQNEIKTIEGYSVKTMSVLKSGLKMKAKISFQDLDSEICPQGLSIKRTNSINEFARKKYQIKKLLSHPIAKNFEIKRNHRI